MTVVLFDLDGTLTDPRVGITKSVAFALARFGIVVDDLDTLVPYIGPPLRESFEKMGGLAPDDAWNAVLAYREYFAETGIFENAVYDGITAVLDELRDRGWRLAVATSKPTVYAERILAHFDLRSFFEVVAGAELDGSRHYKHDVISHALDQLGVEASRDCVMVGDREHDIIGGRRSGLSTVGVTWGYGPREELVAAGADLIVDDIGALTAYFPRPPGLLLSG